MMVESMSEISRRFFRLAAGRDRPVRAQRRRFGLQPAQRDPPRRRHCARQCSSRRRNDPPRVPPRPARPPPAARRRRSAKQGSGQVRRLGHGRNLQVALGRVTRSIRRCGHA